MAKQYRVVQQWGEYVPGEVVVIPNDSEFKYDVARAVAAGWIVYVTGAENVAIGADDLYGWHADTDGNLINEGGGDIQMIAGSQITIDGTPLGSGGSSLTGWSTDEDGTLVNTDGMPLAMGEGQIVWPAFDADSQPAFIVGADLGDGEGFLRLGGLTEIQFNTGGPTRWTIDADGNFVNSGGGALRHLVDQDTAVLEVRDEDTLVVNPYARITWGYMGNEDLDGQLTVQVSAEDNSLTTVILATTDALELNGVVAPDSRVDIRANAGIRFYIETDQAWTIDENKFLFPSAGGALILPTKEGAFSDADYPFGVDGMLGVNTTDHALMFRSGEAWRTVGLTGWETVAVEAEDSAITAELQAEPTSRLVFTVDRAAGSGGWGSENLSGFEVRDIDSEVTDPYARLSMGYGGEEEQDGYILLEMATADGALGYVFWAHSEGVEIHAESSDNAVLDLYANSGIGFHATGNSYPNWRVDDAGMLAPYGPGNAFVLPTKAGTFTDEDYAYGVSGMVGVDTTGERLMVRVGEAWRSIPVGGIAYPFVPPDNSEFAWVNQGGASIDATAVGITLSAPHGSEQCRIRKLAAPSTPYTVTAAFLCDLIAANYLQYGLVFRESSSGKLTTWGAANVNAPVVIVGYFSAPATNDSTPMSQEMVTIPMWFQMSDDGSERIYRWSSDGLHWHEAYREDNDANGMTANEVGWYVDANNGTHDMEVTLVSWEVS